MKIIVKFSELKTRRKLKELGKFFEQNENFVIEINSKIDLNQKLFSFAEEVIHFLIRLISCCSNKKISVIQEEELAKLITSLIFTRLSQGKNEKS